MATPSPHQLFLLADHLKLSLLERQRTISLNLDSTAQDTSITRSLTTLSQGISSLESTTTPADLTNPHSDFSRLKKQYETLSSQFQPTPPQTTTPPPPSTTTTPPTARTKRNVRFRDDPSTDTDAQEITDPIEAANRAALFSSNTKPYTDTPYRDHIDDEELDNQQIHTYHHTVMAEQDEQLDVLGQSVRRQRLLGMQMGEEMEVQNEMLDDVERGVDRHAGTLERARRRLGDVARKGKGNWSWITIGILIVILLLVIIVLK